MRRRPGHSNMIWAAKVRSGSAFLKFSNSHTGQLALGRLAPQQEAICEAEEDQYLDDPVAHFGVVATELMQRPKLDHAGGEWR